MINSGALEINSLQFNNTRSKIWRRSIHNLRLLSQKKSAKGGWYEDCSFKMFFNSKTIPSKQIELT